MITRSTIECDVEFLRYAKGRKTLVARADGDEPCRPTGRVPRLAKLMALALKFEKMVRDGVVADYAQLADIGRVTRARMSQIMALTHLAPDIMAALLFLPRVESGRDPIILAQLAPIAQLLDWRLQRRMWKQLERARATGQSA
jgi:hypothetical protein